MTLHDRSGLAGTLLRHRSAARHGPAYPAPSALSISPSILVAKITPPGLPGWAATRLRISEHQAPPLLHEPLSEREQEVLRHVSGLLSTGEIAKQMYISANTVKTHLRNAYLKLAANNRGEAVRRARQLGLT